MNRERNGERNNLNTLVKDNFWDYSHLIQERFLRNVKHRLGFYGYELEIVSSKSVKDVPFYPFNLNLSESRSTALLLDLAMNDEEAIKYNRAIIRAETVIVELWVKEIMKALRNSPLTSSNKLKTHWLSDIKIKVTCAMGDVIHCVGQEALPVYLFISRENPDDPSFRDQDRGELAKEEMIIQVETAFKVEIEEKNPKIKGPVKLNY